MTMISRILSGMAALLISMSALAADAPDVLIKKLSDEVLTIIRTDKAVQAGDVKRITEVVDAKVLPHLNFMRMTALAVGREWRNATPAQQTELANEFKTLLIRSYAGALSNYRDEQLTFKPLRMQPADTETTVRSEVRRPGAQPVTIDYSLMKDGEAWKVYDVSVAGVSLVTNYREEFGREIRANGVDGLIKTLKAKNAGPVPPAPPSAPAK